MKIYMSRALALSLVVPAAILLLHNLHLWRFELSDCVAIVLWPSSFWLMATAGHGLFEPLTLKILALSLAANVILYQVLAAILYFARSQISRAGRAA